MGGDVSVEASKEYARWLGGSDRRKSLSDRLREERKEKRREKSSRDGLHTKKREEPGTVLLQCSRRP
jgi:hypothetical protein